MSNRRRNLVNVIEWVKQVDSYLPYHLTVIANYNQMEMALLDDSKQVEYMRIVIDTNLNPHILAHGLRAAAGAMGGYYANV